MSSYSSSSQRKFWTFSGPEELFKYRNSANRNYISNAENSKKRHKESCFLTTEEELCVVKHYEKVLKDFLQRFMPKREVLPREVRGTAFHFYKRFFLVSSVMDFHPVDIMYSCVFLSCKICEYVVPIDLFVKNLEGNPNLWKNIITYQESELLYRMNFRINIHTPYRALEGLMIDLRTRSHVREPHRLYEHIHRFLGCMWFTDICLVYSPSQIAFAALMHAASCCKENIDQFVMTTLLHNPPKKKLDGFISTIREIRRAVMNWKEVPSKEQIRDVEHKLAICRNPLNDPSSEVFKRKMTEIALEDYNRNNK